MLAIEMSRRRVEHCKENQACYATKLSRFKIPCIWEKSRNVTPKVQTPKLEGRMYSLHTHTNTAYRYTRQAGMALDACVDAAGTPKRHVRWGAKCWAANRSHRDIEREREREKGRAKSVHLTAVMPKPRPSFERHASPGDGRAVIFSVTLLVPSLHHWHTVRAREKERERTKERESESAIQLDTGCGCITPTRNRLHPNHPN